MSDTKLRDLERRWKETGAVADEAAYLLERVRVGDLTERSLRLAARCGSEAANLASGRGNQSLTRDLGEVVRTIHAEGGNEACLVVVRTALLAGAGELADEPKRLIDAWLTQPSSREPLEDELYHELNDHRALNDATRSLPPERAAALAARVAIALPAGTEVERGRHLESWSVRAVGLTVDAMSGQGRIWANPRRPLPVDLWDRTRDAVIRWVLQRNLD